MSNERKQLLARLRRYAVVLEARGEMYDAETCEQARAALSAPPAGYVLVAWRWRQRGATNWIYDPLPAWLEAQGDDIEKQPLYAAAREPQERVLLMRSAEVGRWIQADDRSISGEYRYATLDPKEGEQT